MDIENDKYIQIGIQDPDFLFYALSQQKPKLYPVDLHLVKRVEDSSYKFYYNKKIDSFFKNTDSLIKLVNIKALSDGYKFIIGGNIITDFLFTNTDKERYPKDFPFSGFSNSNFYLRSDFENPEVDLFNNLFNLERKEKAKEGWLRLNVGINMDIKGELTLEQIVNETTNAFLGKRNVKKKKSLLIGFPQDEEESYILTLENLTLFSSILENCINEIYQRKNRYSKKIGEAQIALVYNNSHQIIFGEYNRSIAKSYDIKYFKGTKIYIHYIDPNEGEYKIGKNFEDSKSRNEETKTMHLPNDKDMPSLQYAKEPLITSPRSQENKNDKEKRDIITFDDVIGAEEAKKQLLKVCEFFLHPEKPKKWGMKQEAGIILHGPSGTGKTLLARAFADTVNAKFFNYNCAQIFGQYIGQSERNMEELLKQATNYERSVILMDEFDAIARKRSLSDMSSHGTEARVVNLLLSFLDGFEEHSNVYLIGTTNRIEAIDEAIIQRLCVIEVPLPNYNDRIALIKYKINKHEKNTGLKIFGDIDYEKIARESEGLSGRELIGDKASVFRRLVEKSMELTFNNNNNLYIITTQDWLDTIKLFKPNEIKKIGF